ncbi:MAG TPA: class I SAM-dependent methyltransferase [Candidatus Acidoferrales bacterium]|nr:class I SAM-dependent methyltransferase [Candidatus Acidoferrales bacterium]
MGMTAAQSVPTTKGLVLHKAFLYDLLLWFLSRGKEGEMRKKALRLARLSIGENVIDIGCGTGTLAIAAKRDVGERGMACGVDASPQMLVRAIKKARKAGLEVDFRNAAVEALPFRDSQFDVVLSTLMLHHLPAKVREQCLQEIRRVLKPGGRALIIDFGPPEPRKTTIIDHFHHHGHASLPSMIELVQRSGMEVAESGAVGICNLNYVYAVAR